MLMNDELRKQNFNTSAISKQILKIHKVQTTTSSQRVHECGPGDRSPWH